MFVRVCPYLPLSAGLCTNRRHWLARGMEAEGLAFRQAGNMFLTCSDPARLQTLAGSLTGRDLERCGHKWLRALVVFFTPTESAGLRPPVLLRSSRVLRQRDLPSPGGAGCARRAPVRRQPHDWAADQTRDDLRPPRHPTRPRQARNRHRRPGSPESGHPHYYRDGSVKQYVRDHLGLRREATSNNTADFGFAKSVDTLPQLRTAMAAVTDGYLTVQQDILETFVDRGQLRHLAEPTHLPSGKRIPSLKLDHPRQLALMHALVRFAHIRGRGYLDDPESAPDGRGGSQPRPRPVSTGVAPL